MSKLQAIFNRQRELSEKFWAIEQSNNLGYGIVLNRTIHPFDISCPIVQHGLRDQAWRIVEECAETQSEWLNDVTEGKEISDATKEEAIDILHFVVELYIKLNTYPRTMVGTFDCDLANLYQEASMFKSPRDAIFSLIDSVAIMANCLKNRPWKQSTKPVDVGRFNHYVRRTFLNCLSICKSLGMSVDDIFHTYMGKAAINKQRQDSGV